MSRRSTMQLFLKVIVLSVLFALLCDAGFADEVTVQDTVLRGTVTAITSTAIEFDTVYGTGTLSIPYENIQNLVTEKDYYIFYGEEGESIGRLVGFDDGTLLVGDDRKTATRVAAATIVSGVPDGEKDRTMSEELRSRFRYWHGNVDFSFGFTQGTTDTTTSDYTFKTTRHKAPTRLTLESRYRFLTEKRQGQSRNVLANQLYGKIQGEYDLTEKWFLLTAGDGLYDEIQRISIRTIPRIGPGYHLYKSDRASLKVSTGPAYNYTRFFGGDIDDFFSLFFGGEANAKLPYNATFEWSGHYVPAVNAWTDNYILRTQASLSVPVIGAFAFKASLYEEYNNQPAQDTVRNALTTTLGLSVAY